MFTRREFLARTGLTTGALAFPLVARAQDATPAARSPNDRLRLAFIGVGGRGGGNLNELASQGDDVVALCDSEGRVIARGSLLRSPMA